MQNKAFSGKNSSVDEVDEGGPDAPSPEEKPLAADAVLWESG